MVQVREVTQAGASRRGPRSSGLHEKASRDMQRGLPVTHMYFAPCCPKAGWGKVALGGSGVTESLVYVCHSSISTAHGCLQHRFLSLSPFPPCPHRLRSTGSASRQLRVCLPYACSQGNERCRQHLSLPINGDTISPCHHSPPLCPCWS